MFAKNIQENIRKFFFDREKFVFSGKYKKCFGWVRSVDHLNPSPTTKRLFLL